MSDKNIATIDFDMQLYNHYTSFLPEWYYHKCKYISINLRVGTSSRAR